MALCLSPGLRIWVLFLDRRGVSSNLGAAHLSALSLPSADMDHVPSGGRLCSVSCLSDGDRHPWPRIAGKLKEC